MFITALVVYSPGIKNINIDKYSENFAIRVIVNECKGGYLHYPEIANGSSVK